MKVPVNEPVISKEAKDNVAKAMNTGWLSSAGPFVSEFEKEFGKYIGVEHAISVSNGTAALHVALMALEIGSKDEVIVPAFAMGACFLSVLYVGAKPVFVDCELDTYNIDPTKIEARITSKTKAIMMVHTYGHACDVDAIIKIAKKHNLKIVEDAAEAHGATYKGKKCGTFGDISCFSFYANKIITTGEGGMVLTNDEKLADKAQKLKDLHHSNNKRFIHDGIGYNYRLTNLQAAMGCGELENIEKYLEKKEWMAKRYNEGLNNISGIMTPTTKPDVKNVYWVYGIMVDEKKFGMNRDKLRMKLKEADIDTRDFFYPPDEQPVLKGIVGKEKFPNAAYAARNGLYLPSGLAITDKQVDYVVATVKKLVEKK